MSGMSVKDEREGGSGAGEGKECLQAAIQAFLQEGGSRMQGRAEDWAGRIKDCIAILPKPR